MFLPVPRMAHSQTMPTLSSAGKQGFGHFLYAVTERRYFKFLLISEVSFA
jgi:hypothetical protein